MKSLTKVLALTATIMMAGWMNSASATLLSFGITGVGSYTVNTTDITALTTTKTLPTTELIGGTTTPGTFALAGLVTGAAASFSTLTFNTLPGAFLVTLTAGNLTFSFTNISSVLIVPSGANSNGSISEQLNGTITGDTSLGQTFLGQTVSLSETCTQTSTGASITCSESVRTPGLPNQVPEPMPLALLGIGLAGLGFATRRRQS